MGIDNTYIGVHYRHPSHSCEQGYVYFQDYFKIIDSLDQTAKIFLATDNDLGVIAFKDRYGDRIVYRKEAKRTNIDNILRWAYSSSKGKPDNQGFIDNEGFQVHYDSKPSISMGIDVIVDTLCLARCGCFVHTISNIAQAVSYINPGIHMLTIKVA